MKLQILSGALGLVLLMSLVPLPNAEAKVFLIDDFSGDPSIGNLPPGTGQSECHQLSDGVIEAAFMEAEQTVVDVGLLINGVFGDARYCSMNIDTPLQGSDGTIRVIGSPHDGAAGTQAEMFRHGAETGIKTTVILGYDCDDDSDHPAVGVAGACDVNLLNSDDINLVHSTADMPVTYTSEITDTDGDWARQVTTLVSVSGMATNNPFLITDYVDNPSASAGTLDLNHISKFTFTFVPEDPETDYDIDLIEVTMEMVGGEMFPVDTTALLLAGVELNVIWILPAIAAIGIGAFIVSRKRN